MFDRLQHFFNTIKTNWSDDPAARGAAKMTAGAVLFAEGMFGTIRSVGSKGSGGLIGGLVGIVAGGVFIVMSQWMTPGFEDQVLTEGQIVDMREGYSDGRVNYSPVYAFTAADREYEFTSSISSSSRPVLGERVQIAYSVSDPRNAYRADGIDGNFHNIFFGAGVLIVVLSVLSVLISIALIAFGIWLFLQGRNDRRSAGATQGFFTDLFSLASKARQGEVKIEETAAGIAGASQGKPQDPL